MHTSSRRPAATRIALSLCFTLALALAGCGGDDWIPGPADKYEGTWVSNCRDAGLYAADRPEQQLKATYRLVLDKTAPDALRFTMTMSIYPASGCGGAALATHTNNAPENRYDIGGIHFVHGTAVDHVTITMGALNASASATGRPIVQNGVRYPADFFVSRVVDNKDILAIDGNGLRFGTGPTNGEGYPSQLESEPSLFRR